MSNGPPVCVAVIFISSYRKPVNNIYILKEIRDRLTHGQTNEKAYITP
jgi:hypothetical protein